MAIVAETFEPGGTVNLDGRPSWGCAEAAVTLAQVCCATGKENSRLKRCEPITREGGPEGYCLGELAPNAADRPLSAFGRSTVSLSVTPAGSSASRVTLRVTSRCVLVPCQFQLSGGKLDQAAPADRQCRVASGRACSARRVHHHQPVAPGRVGRRLLQQARDVQATD